MGGVPIDGRLVCLYDVVDDTNPTTIMNMATSNVDSIEVDGVLQEVNKNYQLSVGEHVVKIKLKDVTTAPAYAFQNVTSLKEVIIPNAVTSIGRDFANGCTMLDSITISENVTSIPMNFAKSTAIGTIIIPNGVTTILASAFMYCANLADVTIPPSVTSCGDYAFFGIKKPGVVRISDIGAWCRIQFYAIREGASPLESAQHIYLNDVELTQIVVPNDITSLLPRVFAGAKAITHISLPDTITGIGRSAFEGCASHSIDMSNSVISIEVNAFYSSGFLSITFPTTLATIGTNAFRYMPNPKVTILATTPPTIPNANSAFMGSGNFYVYVPDEVVDDYKIATGWSSIATRIKGVSER